MSVNKNRCVVRTRKKNFEKSIKFSRFAGSFQEISSLGSAFFTLRWFQLAHIFVVWASCFIPLLGRTRSRVRCVSSVSSSRTVRPCFHEEVVGLDIGGQRGRGFVLLRHTPRPQRDHTLICASRSGIDRHLCTCLYSCKRLLISGMRRVPHQYFLEKRDCTIGQSAMIWRPSYIRERRKLTEKWVQELFVTIFWEDSFKHNCILSIYPQTCWREPLWKWPRRVLSI